MAEAATPSELPESAQSFRAQRLKATEANTAESRTKLVTPLELQGTESVRIISEADEEEGGCWPWSI